MSNNPDRWKLWFRPDGTPTGGGIAWARFLDDGSYELMDGPPEGVTWCRVLDDGSITATDAPDIENAADLDPVTLNLRIAEKRFIERCANAVIITQEMVDESGVTFEPRDLNDLKKL